MLPTLPRLEGGQSLGGEAPIFSERAYSESLFIKDVIVDAQVSPPYLLRLVTGVVSESFYESEFAVEWAQVVALEINV